MVGNLIESLKEFKVAMEYNNFDINADKPRQYEEVRRSLSRKYFDHPEFLGPDKRRSMDRNPYNSKCLYPRYRHVPPVPYSILRLYGNQA